MERVESRNQPTGLSAKTVRNISQVISSAMDFAIDQKLITTNPTNGCALPKLEHREMKTISEHFPVWVSAWVKALTHFLIRIIFQQKQMKSHEILRILGVWRKNLCTVIATTTDQITS